LHAEIYKWVDEQGQVHYSDQKPEDRPVTEIPMETRSYQEISYRTVEVDTRKVAPEARVVMLSASWCGSCKKAKQYFRRNGIAFLEYDIEKSSRGKRLYEQLGATGVPVILVGKKRMNGFTEAGFERLIR
jgi:glutaredoxin